MSQETSVRGELPHKHHVVYVFSDGPSNGLGSIDISSRQGFRSQSHVQEVREWIEEHTDVSDVVILSWCKYEKESLLSKIRKVFRK